MSPRSRHQAGFTLIEMIVVLVVLALAMAVVFPALGNMLRSTSRTSASSQASGEAQVAADLLRSDVRTAAGARSTGERTDSDLFAGATAVTLSTVGSLNALAPGISDIVTAGPLVLVFNSDVLATSPGPERVAWTYLENSATCGDRSDANTNWCMQRTVSTQAGTVLTSEIVVRARGTLGPSSSCFPGAAAMKRVFCYEEAVPVMAAGGSNRYTWDAGWSSNCSESWLTDAGSPNQAGASGIGLGSTTYTLTHNGAEPSTKISRLDRIVSVGASLQSGGAYGNASERGFVNVQVGIRARQNEAYKEAIMCGSRAGWGG
jgi:prepilin-type N-terminal cleavage/methylation domain-containing protein